MTPKKKPSVLACVTGQYDCDRIISAGYEIANEQGYELHVLCVHTPMSNASLLSDEIEYLYQTSKRLGADMTIAFNHNAPKTAADFVKKINAKCIVTGMPDGSPNGFIDTLQSLSPKSNITMVTKEGEHLTYNKECMLSIPA
jgi:K+-sensing histidine kinase KdpD